MIDTDIDTPVALEKDADAEARLPWESIDPDETPTHTASPFASTALVAVEAEKAGPADPSRSNPILKSRLAVAGDDEYSALDERDREERHASRAFFSDEVISLEKALAVEIPAPPADINAGHPVISQHTFEQPAAVAPKTSDDYSTVAADRFTAEEFAMDIVKSFSDFVAQEHRSQETADESIPTSADVFAGVGEDDFDSEESDSPITSVRRHSEEPGHSQVKPGSSEYLRTGVGEENEVVAGVNEHVAGDKQNHQTSSDLLTASRFSDEETAATIAEENHSENETAAPAIAAAPRIEALEESEPVFAATVDQSASDEASATVPGDEHPVDEHVVEPAPVMEIATPAITTTYFDSSRIETGEGLGSSVVFRTLPAGGAADPTVTFSTADAINTSAAELSTLAESFAAEVVEHPGDETIVVPVTEADGVFAVTAPQLEVQPQLAADVQTAVEPALAAPAPSTGGGWTIPLMCLGIGLIACCMVIPQGESNRRLRYEQASLAADYQQVQKQVAVNDEFLKKVADDPTLAERLAGRQMKTIRKGQEALDLKQTPDDSDMSPFSLVNVARPESLPPYKPKTGTIANLCNNSRSRLYLLGASLAMVAVGLVMGAGGNAKSPVGSTTFDPGESDSNIPA